jgi:hypothetical protein
MNDTATKYIIDDQKATSSECCLVRVDFDPFAPQFRADPFAVMGSVRDTPVFYSHRSSRLTRPNTPVCAREPQRISVRSSITRPVHSLSMLRRVSYPTAAQDSLPDGWPAFPGRSWLPA